MHLFKYKGIDLQFPLERLLRYLISMREHYRKELSMFTHVNESEFIEWASSSDDKSNFQRNQIARKFVSHIASSRETEIFLFEVKRNPEDVWNLTIEELARLYPVQVAHETMAAELLSKL